MKLKHDRGATGLSFRGETIEVIDGCAEIEEISPAELSDLESAGWSRDDADPADEEESEEADGDETKPRRKKARRK